MVNSSSAKKHLTIICPAYNEEETIPLFHRALQPVTAKLSNRYEIDVLFLNNASTDHTLEKILELREQDRNVFVITMSRNVGYQASIDCGLRHAEGDLFVLIDVDGEDPPEMICDFVDKYEVGYDIVYGERVDREEPAPIKFLRRVFYRILRAVADDDIILDMAEFSLLTEEVRDAVVQVNTSYPFVRALIGRVGFTRCGIPFKRHRRIAGVSHYRITGMIVFGLAGILAASTLLLRVPLYLFPLWLLLLIGLGMGYVWTQQTGLAVTIAVLVAGYLGYGVSVIALYTARSYKNGLHRANAYIHRRYSILQTQDRK